MIRDKKATLSWVRFLKNELAEYEKDGYCQHGKSKRSYSLDMERDCFACEMGEERNIYREAIAEVNYLHKIRTVGVLRQVILSGDISDADILRVIEMNFTYRD